MYFEYTVATFEVPKAIELHEESSASGGAKSQARCKSVPPRQVCHQFAFNVVRIWKPSGPQSIVCNDAKARTTQGPRGWRIYMGRKKSPDFATTVWAEEGLSSRTGLERSTLGDVNLICNLQ